MKTLPFTAIFAALAIFTVSAEAAGGKGMKLKPSKKPTPVPEKVKSFAEIKSVSGDSITIEHSKTTTTYKMSNETQIQIDGTNARSTSLKPGMHVAVTASSINPGFLLSVTATTAPKN
jgi:hypothetical protein